jgi:hypothetical protein
VRKIEEEIKRLQSEVEYWRIRYYDTKDEVDYWKNEYEISEEELTKQYEQVSITDLNHFIWRLKADNLYTYELEQFIEEYMKFYNK